MTVLVYSKPGCVQCVHTVKQLAKLGVPHRVIDVTQDRQAEQLVRDTGDLQMPYVVAGDQTWHGFRIEKIRGLSNHS